VGGRQAVLDRHRLQRRQQRVAVIAQQPRPDAWREGHRHLQFRVIVSAGPLPGVGPAMVEHIFALAVGLEISGRRGRDPAGSFDHDRQGGPARPFAHAPAAFEQREECMAEEGISTPGQSIPLLRRQIGHAPGDPCDNLSFAVCHRLPR
jgi:hypothetical protein